MSEFDDLLKALNEGMSSPDYKDSVNAAGDFASILKKHVEEAVAEYMAHPGQEVDTGPDSPFVENLMLDLPGIVQGAFNDQPAVAEGAPEGGEEELSDYGYRTKENDADRERGRYKVEDAVTHLLREVGKRLSRLVKDYRESYPTEDFSSGSELHAAFSEQLVALVDKSFVENE